MNKCEKIDFCTFFTNRATTLLTEQDRMRVKVQYCIVDKTRCARYKVKEKLYKGFMPCNENAMYMIDQKMDILYPDDVELATEIINLLCVD